MATRLLALGDGFDLLPRLEGRGQRSLLERGEKLALFGSVDLGGKQPDEQEL